MSFNPLLPAGNLESEFDTEETLLVSSDFDKGFSWINVDPFCIEILKSTVCSLNAVKEPPPPHHK